MSRRALLAVVACALFAVPAAAQMENDILDVFTVQVKPEKAAQFEALAKKIVAANRQNKGSDWLALANVFGPGQTIRFVSARQNFAAIEKSNDVFMAAMNKAYGQAATEQIFHDADSCMESSRSEVRRRRWDLSSNAPADGAAMANLIGGSRWAQTTMVRVRPGHTLKFEEQLRVIKAAREKATPKITTLVSQAVAGQTGTVYYVTTLRKSLAEIDSATPLPKLLGEDAYEKFLKVSAESVLTTESTIARFWPELSNPSEEIAAAAPDFWRPKPAAARTRAKEEPAKAPKKEP